jgi:amino acid permease
MSTPRLTSSDGLRFLTIALVLFEGGIHLQQYEGALHRVPTINALFLANAISVALIALALAVSRDRVGILLALAAIGMTVVALVSLAISRASTLFGYSEPTLRAPVVLAVAVEMGVVVAAAAFVAARIADISRRASIPA